MKKTVMLLLALALCVSAPFFAVGQETQTEQDSLEKIQKEEPATVATEPTEPEAPKSYELIPYLNVIGYANLGVEGYSLDSASRRPVQFALSLGSSSRGALPGNGPRWFNAEVTLRKKLFFDNNFLRVGVRSFRSPVVDTFAWAEGSKRTDFGFVVGGTYYDRYVSESGDNLTTLTRYGVLIGSARASDPKVEEIPGDPYNYSFEDRFKNRLSIGATLGFQTIWNGDSGSRFGLDASMEIYFGGSGMLNAAVFYIPDPASFPVGFRLGTILTSAGYRTSIGATMLF